MRHHAPRQGVTTPGSECSRQMITHRHQRMRPAIRGDRPPRGTLSHGRHRSAEWINTDAPALGLSPSLEVEREARRVSVVGVRPPDTGGRAKRTVHRSSGDLATACAVPALGACGLTKPVRGWTAQSGNVGVPFVGCRTPRVQLRVSVGALIR